MCVCGAGGGREDRERVRGKKKRKKRGKRRREEKREKFVRIAIISAAVLQSMDPAHHMSGNLVL